MDNTVNNNAVLDAAIVKKIAEHYRHARAKHPYFADRLLHGFSDPDIWNTHLSIRRRELARQVEIGNIVATTVLNTEKAEIAAAIANGDTAHAVEECYDAIAVLLRMVDVLEGRQKLGRPECER